MSPPGPPAPRLSSPRAPAASLPLPEPDAPEVIHRSGRTLVFQATGPGGERWVVKTPAAAIPSDDTLAALREEARLLQRLAGPGLPPFVALLEGSGSVQLVVEDQGVFSLDRLALPLPVDEVVQILDEAAAVLGRLHDAGLVHRDLHPGNLCWGDAPGSLVLVDLGLVAPPSRPEASRGGGTLRTLPPEQTGRTRLGVDHRADLYSLGAVAFELLAGRPVFEETEALALVHAHLARRPEDLRGLRPGLPVDLGRVVARLLEKDPERRYQGCHGLRVDLGRLRAGEVGFPLGEEDPPPVFRLPARLFGRDAEGAALTACLDEVLDGGRRVVSVEGPVGIGKSALAAQLAQEARQRGVRVAQGGFQVQRHDQPLEALWLALIELLSQVEPDEEARIGEALGDLAPAMAVQLPVLEAVLGPQAAPAAVGPGEARLRTIQGTLALLGALCRPERPLVLVLDDLQWARGALAGLVRAVAEDVSLRGLLLVLVIRDDAAADDELPVASVLTALEAGDVLLQRLRLPPLSPGAVGALVAAALRQPAVAVAPLAQALSERTGGNPLAVRAQLVELCQQGLLVRDGPRWTWRPAALREVAVAEEVLDLLLLRMDRLGRDAYVALQAAAVVGQRFELGVLSAVLGWSPARLVPALEECVSRGMLAAEEVDWALTRHAEAVGLPAGERPHWLHFVHSRVVEAAVAQLDHTERAELHLRAGRLCMAVADGDVWLEAAASGHLRHTLHRLEDDAERLAVCDLAERVAVRATSAGSTDKALAALELAEAAVGTRDPDRWERIAVRAVEVAAAGDREQAMHAWRARLDARVRSLANTVGAVCAQIEWAARRDDLAGAVAAARGFLDQAGEPMALGRRPLRVLGALARLLWVWRGRRVEALLDAPEPRDPLVRAVARVHGVMALPHSAFDPGAVPEQILIDSALLLEHGPIPEGAMAYTGPALLFSQILGRQELGLRLGELALAVVERPGGELARGQVAAVVLVAVMPMARPLAEVTPLLFEEGRRAMELGDVEPGAAMLVAGRVNLLCEGRPLGEIQAGAQDDLQRLRRALSHRRAAVAELLLELLGLLQGGGPPQTTPPPTTTPPSFQPTGEDAISDRIAWGLCQVLAGLGELDPEARVALIREPWPHPSYPARYAVGFLGRAARAVAAQELASSGHVHRKQARALLREARRELRSWSRTVRERRFLVDWVDGAAALAAGRWGRARSLLVRSSDAAQAWGARHVAAHAAKLAARAAAELGQVEQSSQLAARAHALYRQWGARGRAATLEARQPELTRPLAGRISASSGTNRHIHATVEASAEALQESTEDAEGERVSALVELARTIGGGTWAAVVRRSPDGAIPVACAGAPERTGVPESALREALRGGAAFVVDDAQVVAPHRADPVVVEAGLRAMLVHPIGDGRAVLYVENDLVPGAFSAADLATLARTVKALEQAL